MLLRVSEDELDRKAHGGWLLWLKCCSLLEDSLEDIYYMKSTFFFVLDVLSQVSLKLIV